MKQGGKGRLLIRLECIFFTFALLFTSLAFGGCTRKKTKKEKAEQSARASASKAFRDAEKETEEPETEAPTETSLPTDDEAKEEALKIATSVGLSDEDLRGQYSFFLRYADAIYSNPDLLDFDCYVYKLFPIVADHLESEDEAFFLRKLNTLSFEFMPWEDPKMWGGFEPYNNRISIGTKLYDQNPIELNATGVYHELMHFLDSCIDGRTTICYVASDGTIQSAHSVNDDDVQRLEAPYWAEGGSELYYARYLTHAPETGAYIIAEQFLVGMEYIFGCEKVDELFFSHETDPLFIELLRQNDFSDEEVIKLYNVMQKMLDGSEITEPEKYMDPREALIRLYIKNIGPDYEKDAAFCRILGLMENNILKKIPSEYREFINSLKKFSESDEKAFLKKIREEKGYSSEGMYFLLPPSPFFVDGELKVAGLFYVKENGKKVIKSANMGFDFTNNTVLSVEVFDSFVPEVIEKTTLPSDATQEGKDYVASQMRDNSAAHDLKIKGNDSAFDYNGFYKRAEDIAFTYGVEVWFGDLTPSGALFSDDIRAWDSYLIDNALTQIEAVLSIYPRDYLEQLLFKYYSGVAICLYDGYYEYANPSHLFLKNKNYLMFYVDVSLDCIHEFVGADNILEAFPSVDCIAGQLICDIWSQTERVMKSRNACFDEVTYSNETWAKVNPKGFEYLYVDNPEDLNAYAEKNDLNYFLTAGSFASPENDRALFYEFMMLCTLTGTSDIEITPEMKGKFDELQAMIRFYFSTVKWSTSTPWEETMKTAKVKGQDQGQDAEQSQSSSQDG